MGIAQDHDLLSPTEVRAGKSVALQRALIWTNDFIAQPHRDLGRVGAVCPFVPEALSLETAWFAELDINDADIKGKIKKYKDAFLQLIEPTNEKESLNKTIILVIANNSPEVGQFVEKTHRILKPSFTDDGLMIGQFYAECMEVGIHSPNPDFHPLQSPSPMLAIRRMVIGDLPFLLKTGDPCRYRYLFGYIGAVASGHIPIAREHTRTVYQHLSEAYEELRELGPEVFCRDDEPGNND